MTDPAAPTTPAADEERVAFKRQELEAAKAIMAGDRYCPDPSVHEATPAEPLDVERLAARLLEGQKRQGGSVPLADENEARAYAAWLLGASDEEAAEYARLTTTDEGEEEERPSIEDEWYEQDSGGGDGSAKGADATPAQAATSLPRPSSGCRHQWTHIGGYPGEPEGLAYDMCSKCGKVKGLR